jgi:hypothetical protein
MRKLMTNNKNVVALSVFVAFSACLFAAPANAAAVNFNNIGGVTAGTDPVATVGPLADSFSTAEYGTTLNEVSVRLLAGTPSDGGSIRVQLLANSSNNPGAMLTTIGTLSDSSLSSSLANYTLTLATPYSLAANTRYWIELVSAGSSAEWAWSYDQSGPGVANQYLSNTFGTFANSGSAPYQMQVVTAAPEPAGLASIGIALVGVAAVIRRRLTA